MPSTAKVKSALKHSASAWVITVRTRTTRRDSLVIQPRQTVSTPTRTGFETEIAAKAADKSAAMRMIAPVESEVRQLLGNAIFAADEETMELVTGKLLREKNHTVAVCEDLTCGHLAERLQTGSGDRFLAGFIANGPTSLRGILVHARRGGRWTLNLGNPAAWAVLAGVAVLTLLALLDVIDVPTTGGLSLSVADVPFDGR